jgi:hypothetical protein
VASRGIPRASVAASFLDADGRAVVVIDDDFGRAARVGLPVVTPAPVPPSQH